MADPYILVLFNHLRIRCKKKNYIKSPKDEKVKYF